VTNGRFGEWGGVRANPRRAEPLRSWGLGGVRTAHGDSAASTSAKMGHLELMQWLGLSLGQPRVYTRVNRT